MKELLLHTISAVVERLNEGARNNREQDIEAILCKVKSTAASGENAAGWLSGLWRKQNSKDLYTKTIDNERGLEEMGVLPQTDAEMRSLFASRHLVEERIKSGWYKGRYIALTTLSGNYSSFLVRYCQDTISNYANLQAEICEMKLGWDFKQVAGSRKISHGCLLNMPDGGVRTGPYMPGLNSYRALLVADASLVVLFRHPADLLVEMTFDLWNAGYGEKGITFNELLLALIRSTILDVLDKLGDEQVFTLPEILHWSVSWLRLGKDRKALLLRHEDIFNDPDKELLRLHNYLLQEVSVRDEKSYESITQVDQGLEGIETEAGNTIVQPKLWQNYFRPEHTEAYNLVVEAALRIHDNSEDLLAMYPDLQLNAA